MHNDHQTILAILKEAKSELENAGATVCAVVGDNHSRVQKAVAMFCEGYPLVCCESYFQWLEFLNFYQVFRVRCVAHSLQLLMQDLYKSHPMNEACRLPCLGESILTQEDAESVERYWTLRAISAPPLAKAALRFLSISPTEAAVERAYSHLKHTHSQLRNRLKEPSVNALMFVRMNAVPLGIVAR